MRLLELKNKLSREEILLKEQRYLLGDSGHYELIHSIEQKELICGCTLFNWMNLKENEILKKYSEAEIVPSPKAAIDMIHKILRVIDYELETVNHSRRIEWQNKEIEHYTEKNSQILQYKKWVNSIRMQMQFIFSAEGIAGNLRHSILIRMVLCCSRKGLTETAGSSGRGMLRKPVF